MVEIVWTTYMQRDLMAAFDMYNLVQNYFLHQQHPLYLQPVDEDGHYPWMEEDSNPTSPADDRALKREAPTDRIDPCPANKGA
ncbi:hypothetical protein KI688_011940 [Linnemannia hyalina]|uniref:Uncharacterized protein n=1 Tax=Linnemannia hyalina TaxID=64524 RepID=A0A9P7XTN5_9FUNG|nr:hypothetical protein KI688_011940 [Linnemannia hyalina]